MNAGDRYATTLIGSRAELEGLEAEWSALQAGAHDLVLGHRWFAAAATLHEAASLRIITVRRAGRLAGIAPMAEARQHGTVWLELIGTRVLHEPAGMPAEDSAALEALCEALVRQRRPFVLQRVDDAAPLPTALRTASRWQGLVLRLPSPPCQRVDLPGAWDEYFDARSAGFRSRLRRKRRLLEAQGTVTVEHLRPGAGDLEAAIAEAADVEADGWKGAAGSSIRQNERLRRFLLELAARFASKREFQVSFLRVGADAVAMNVLVEHDRRLWELKTGYREAWSRTSPGLLLLWETLRDAHARGLQGYEFLGAGDARQRAWSTSERHLQTFVYFPGNLAGIRALCGVAAGRLARVFR